MSTTSKMTPLEALHMARTWMAQAYSPNPDDLVAAIKEVDAILDDPPVDSIQYQGGKIKSDELREAEAHAARLASALQLAYHAMRHPTGDQQEWKDQLENRAMPAARKALDDYKQDHPKDL